MLNNIVDNFSKSIHPFEEKDMDLIPKKVNICECWARDGIQGEAQFIPTEKKIEMINRMIKAGFKRIEATSFAHPKLVKQFSDSLEVLKGIDRPEDVKFIAIIPNDKALDRLLDACDKGFGVHEITAIISASEDHLLANLERTFKEAMPPLAEVVRRARKAGLQVIGCIGTAFGCPLRGEVPLEKVIELTDWYLEQGATSIMLGDTTGEANPLQVREVYGKMRDRFPGVDFIAHFHDTRGMGLANTLAALQEGVVYHDSSLGGIGGQPATRRPRYHRGFAGNTCTEDMVIMMNEMGIDTGLNIHDVIDLGIMAEKVCGRELLSHVTRSGPIRHRSKRPLSINDLRPGWEIPPSLFLYSRDMEEKGLSCDDIPLLIIRDALDKNWPIPEGLSIDLGGVSPKVSLGEREILITRFECININREENRANLRVLSQRSDGEPYLDGEIKIYLPSNKGD
jgi:hydroxymethylglutaryl-CoA lyase